MKAYSVTGSHHQVDNWMFGGTADGISKPSAGKQSDVFFAREPGSLSAVTRAAEARPSKAKHNETVSVNLYITRQLCSPPSFLPS